MLSWHNRNREYRDLYAGRNISPWPIFIISLFTDDGPLASHKKPGHAKCTGRRQIILSLLQAREGWAAILLAGDEMKSVFILRVKHRLAPPKPDKMSERFQVSFYRICVRRNISDFHACMAPADALSSRRDFRVGLIGVK